MSPTIYQLKPAFQRLLRPVVRWLAGTRITPNQVTVGTALLMGAMGLLLVRQPGHRGLWALLPGVLLVRMALNAIDGMLATSTGRESPLGAVLNEVGDIVGDVVLYAPLALVAGVDGRLAIGAVVGAVLVELVGLAPRLGGSARRFQGPMGKSDRAAVYGVLGLLVAAGVPAPWLNGLLVAVLVLLALTMVNRLRGGARPPTP